MVAVDSCFAGAYFDDASALQCSFQGCDFEDISWLSGKFEDVSFGYSQLTEAVFDGSMMHDVSFFRAHGRIVSFDRTRLFEISWLKSSFTETSFLRTDMPRHPIYMGETSFSKPPDGEEDWDELGNVGADFSNSAFEDAELSDLDFAQSNLNQTTFYWSNLSGANLRSSTGVWAGAFRGADLAGATLPQDISFVSIIDRIQAAVSLARPAYLTNLVTCAAVILSVLVTSNASTIMLPLFGIPVDTVSFAIYGLSQSAIISVYVGIYLVRIWEGVAELPVIHPNGLATPDLVSPWTVIAPMRLHLRVTAPHKHLRLPSGYGWQYLLSVLSHWLLTPITAGALAWSYVDIDRGTAAICASISVFSLLLNAWMFWAGTGVLRGTRQSGGLR